MYGLHKRPSRIRNELAHQFLLRVRVLEWKAPVAECYGALRAELSNQGITLGALDMQIAAHAKAENCILVTADKPFGYFIFSAYGSAFLAVLIGNSNRPSPDSTNPNFS
ncbi:MAG: PIN domain-containing protein [Alcanivorax sp.]|nr:PIN domain-containing protein [Alcanivorax sp.]